MPLHSANRLYAPLQVQGLKSGDRVVPISPGLGTWREAGHHEETALHKIAGRLPLGVAATLLVK
jgi:hypothetical protein